MFPYFPIRMLCEDDLLKKDQITSVEEIKEKPEELCDEGSTFNIDANLESKDTEESKEKIDTEKTSSPVNDEKLMFVTLDNDENLILKAEEDNEKTNTESNQEDLSAEDLIAKQYQDDLIIKAREAELNAKNDQIEIKVNSKEHTLEEDLKTKVNDSDLVASSPQSLNISEKKKETEVEFSTSSEINNKESGIIIADTEGNVGFEVGPGEQVPESFHVEDSGGAIEMQETGIIPDGTEINHIVSGDLSSEPASAQLESSVEGDNLVIVQRDGAIVQGGQTSKLVNEVALNLPTLNSEQITLTQKDGKTIAILTLPPSSPSKQDHQKTILHIQNPHNSNVQQIVLPEQMNQNQHGYVVKETSKSPSFSTAADDGASFIKISSEPAKMTNLQNSQVDSEKRPPNPVKGHGRVVKPDAPSYNVIVKTPQQASPVVSTGGKSQSYSLLTPPVTQTVTSEKKEPEVLPKLTNQISGGSIHGSIKLTGQGSNQKQNLITCILPPSAGKIETGNALNSQSIQVLDKHPLNLDPSAGSSAPTVIRITKMPMSGSESDLSDVLSHDVSSVISKALEELKEKSSSEGYTDQRKVIIKEAVNAEKIIHESKTLEAKSAEDGKSIEENISLSLECNMGEKEPENKMSVLECENEKEFSISSISDHQLVATESQDILTDSAESDGENEETSALNQVKVIKVKTEPDGDESVQVQKEMHSGLVQELISKSKLDNVGRIKIVENGVEYEVKIVSDDSLDENNEGEEGKEIILKQEAVDEEILNNLELEEQTSDNSKHTSGTQTLYTSGEVLKRQVFTAAQGPIHKLATVEMKDGQKRQYYYVSVVANKKFDVRFKSGSARTPACVVNDEGYYCCDKCNYKTERKANFYKHRRLHTGAKPHTCPVCEYKAGTSSNLKRHMGIHEDIRQHKCEICGLCFRQKIHLERHVKYKHEVKPNFLSNFALIIR